MAGIAGAYQQEDGALLAAKMVGALLHRGPDGEGSYSYISDTVSTHLNHRSFGATGAVETSQPVTAHGLVVALDGEIYGRQELRYELSCVGVETRDNTSAELVLKAWRHWGPGCLRKLRGAFALVVFDEATGTLYLARDHLGVKPLHFYPRQRGVVFASELKAITSALGSELEVDPSALVAATLYPWVPERRCAYVGVTKLAPGTSAEFRRDSTCEVKPYFDGAEFAAAAAAGPPVNLAEVITTSVTAHLAPGVPTGVLLNPGPASLIVAATARHAGQVVQAFVPDTGACSGAPEAPTWAHQLARHIGLDLHPVAMSPGAPALLMRLVGSLDEPVADPAAVQTLALCDAAGANGTRVVLSAAGADELFGTYPRHRSVILASRYQALPDAGRRWANTLLSLLASSRVFDSKLGAGRHVQKLMTLAAMPEEAAFRNSYSLHQPSGLMAMLDPELAEDVDDLLEEHLETYCDNYLSDQVGRMCLAEMRLGLPSSVLNYVDQLGAVARVDARLPFADPVVARAAFSTLARRRPWQLSGRPALRAVAAQWLPSELTRADNAPSAPPLRSWLAGELEPMLEEVLLCGQLVNTGFLQPAALSHIVGQHRRGAADLSRQIWQLLVLELWYRQNCRAGVGL